jgi:hypothetical protein
LWRADEQDDGNAAEAREKTTTAAPAPSPTETEGKRGEGRAVCQDARGDGTKAQDLTKVVLVSDGRELTITYMTSRPMPTNDTVLYAITAWSADGNAGYQLGVKYLDGRQIAYFVADLVAANQVNLDGDPQVSGTTVTATFPMDEIRGLGVQFDWAAVVTGAGTDIDFCPDEGDDILNPKQEVFPQ